MLPAPKAPWVGRWYRGDAAECKQDPTQNDLDVLIYEADSVTGYEFQCEITGSKRSGPAHELSLSCGEEGVSVKRREIVELIDDHLKRTVFLNRKPQHNIFRKCPD